MFESLLSTILVRVLGDYVEGIDSKSLSLSVWSGVVELNDLRLKRSAFEALDIPVVVLHGYIGRLNINVPWSSLQSSPVIAELSDLYILVSPKKNYPVSQQDAQEKAQLVKQRQLASYEANKTTRQSEDAKKNQDLKNDPGFMSKLVDTILSNFQLLIHNVHVRYEDVSNPQKKIFFGISLKDLTVQSTNANWQVAFIKDLTQFVYKLAQLKSLSIYLNRDDTILSEPLVDVKQFRTYMQGMVERPKDRHYLVLPIDGAVKMIMQREGKIDKTKPKFQIDLLFDSFCMQLDNLQYRNILRILEYMSSFQQYEKYAPIRPKIPASTKAGCQQWLLYGLKAAYQESSEGYFTWDTVMQRKREKDGYIALYKRSKKVPWLAKLEVYDEDKLKMLERKIDFESLAFYRELAEAELNQESKKYAEQEKSRGWFSGWWSGNKGDANEQMEMTEDDRQRLYKTVGYTVADQIASTTQVDPNFVNMCISFLLSKVEIQLLDADSRKPFINATVNDLRAAFLQRAQSFSVQLSLQSFEIVDRHSKTTLYPQIVTREISPIHGDAKQDPLLLVNLESNPQHGKSDLDVKVLVDEMNFVIVPPFIQRILGFFIVPADIDLTVIQQIAKQQISSIQQQAATQLRLALENKKVIDINFQLKSPKLIIPEDYTSEKSPMIVLDLGQLNIKSDIDKAERQRRLDNQNLKDEDFYDKFQLAIKNIQIVIADYQKYKEMPRVEECGNNLLEKVDINLALNISIVPSNEKYAQTKLVGTVPSIRIDISLEKIDAVLRIFNRIMVIAKDPTGSIKSEDVTRKGTILLMGPIEGYNTFKECFVELRPQSLTIFENENEKQPLAYIALNDNLILNDLARVSPDPNLQNAFEIILPQPSGDDIKFTISSLHRIEWYEAVRQQVYDFSKTAVNKFETLLNKRDEATLSRTQEVIAVSLQIKEIALKLHYKGEDVAALRLRSLDLSYNSKNFDMLFTMKLYSLEILDMLEMNAEKHILSSILTPEQVAEIGNKENTLVQLTFAQAQKRSPFLDLHPIGISPDIKAICPMLIDASSALVFRFNQLNVFFDPVVLSKTVMFVFDLIDLVNQNSKSSATTYTGSEKKQQPEKSAQEPTSQDKRAGSFKLSAIMNGLSLILVDFGSTFTTFSMKNTTVNVFTAPMGLLVDGRIGNMLVEDRSDDSIYPEVLGVNTKKHSLINFEYSQRNNLTSPQGVPFFNKFIKLRMDSVKFVFLMRLINKLKLYFVEGPLLEALKSGSKKAAEKATDLVMKQSESIEMINFDFDFVHPLVIVPVSHISRDKIVLNLGKIQIKNDLEPVVDTVDKKYTSLNWVEKYTIQLEAMNIKTAQKSRVSTVVESMNLSFFMNRAVVNKLNEIPNLDMLLSIPNLALHLTQTQYQMIFQILDQNINDKSVQLEPSTESPANLPTAQQEAQKTSAIDVVTPTVNNISQKVVVTIPEISLLLLRGGGFNKDDDQLARLNMKHLTFTQSTFMDKTSDMNVVLKQVIALDLRTESKSAFKEFISPTLNPQNKASNMNFLSFTMKTIENTTFMNVQLGDARVFVVPDVIMEIKDFFTNQKSAEQIKLEEQMKKQLESPKPQSQSMAIGDIIISGNTWLGEDLMLSPERKLYIKKNEQKEVVLNGEGHTIFFKIDKKNGITPLVHIEEGMTLKIRNLKINYSGDLNKYIYKGKNAVIMAPSTQGVFHIHPKDNQANTQTVSDTSSISSHLKENSPKKLSLSASLAQPTFILPEDSSNPNSRAFVIELSCKASYDQEPKSEQGSFTLRQLQCYVEAQGLKLKGASIVEPIDLTVILRSSTDNDNTYRVLTVDVGTAFRNRISYQDVKMISKILEAFNKKPEKKINNIGEGSGTITEADLGIFTIDDNENNPSDDDNDFGSAKSDDEFQDAMEVIEPVLAPPEEKPKEPEPQPENETKPVDSEYDDDEFSVASKPEQQKTTSVSAINGPKQVIDVAFASTNTVSLFIVDDLQGFDTPLLELKVQQLRLQSRVRMGQFTTVEAALTFELYGNFFNNRLSDWEPFIEPWPCIVEFARSVAQEEQCLYVNRLILANSTIPNAPSPPTLNVNITKTMLDTITTTANLWKEDFTSTTSISVQTKPFLVRNHTGTKISYAKDNVNFKELYPGKEEDFTFKENTRANLDTYKKDQQITIEVTDIGKLSISVKRIGKTIMTTKDRTRTCLIEVEQMLNRKIITVRSNLFVVNSTTVPWELGIFYKDKMTPFGCVEPGGIMGIPVADSNAIFCVHPARDENYSRWSEQIQPFRLSEIVRSDIPRLLTCKNSDEFKKELSFHCVMRSQSFSFTDLGSHSTFKDHKLELVAPLTIENVLGVLMDYTLYDKTTPKSAKMQILKGSLKCGEKIFVYTANLKNSILMRVSLPGKIWQPNKLALINSNQTPSEPLTRSLAIYDGENNSLNLNMEYFHTVGTAHREVFVFVSYWFMNRTGQQLSISENVNKVAGLDVLNTPEHEKQQPSPLMFSFRDANNKNNKIKLSINGSPPSRGFSIDNPGVAGDIELVSDKKYNIGLYVSVAPGKFKRSKIVVFSSRFVVVNKMDTSINYKQDKSAIQFSLAGKEQANFFWPETSATSPMLQITTDKAKYNYSTPFPLNVLGENIVKLINKDKPEEYEIISVNLVEDSATIFIMISRPEKPPYIIFNHLEEEIEISQKNVAKTWLVAPLTKYPYAWDDNIRSQELNIRISTTMITGFKVNRVMKPKVQDRRTLESGKTVYLAVRAKGPTRVLHISYIALNEEEIPEIETLSCEAIFSSIGISLVNDRPQEVAYVFIDNLTLDYSQTTRNMYANVMIRNLQVDNMQGDILFPIVLASRRDKGSTRDFLQLGLCKSLEEKSVTLVPYFSINVQEVDIMLEYSFIRTIQLFIESLLAVLSKSGSDLQLIEETFKEIDHPNLEYKGRDFFFERFELHPIKMNLSFKFNRSDDESEKQNPIVVFLENLGVVSFDEAPLRFNALLLEYPFLNQAELYDRIYKHYLKAVTYELYKILGSLDMIGNPVKLFNDISTGVSDLFYEPAQAVTKSPKEFGKGMYRGAESFFTKVAGGTFSSASRFAGTLAQASRVATLDKEYIKESERAAKSRPKDLKEGIVEGGEAFAKGFKEAATGIFTKPIEGANKEGVVGFVKGVVVAGISVPMKPIAGVLDLVQKSAEGMSGNAGRHERRRPVRTFREDGVLTCYDYVDALAKSLIKEVDKGKFAQEIPHYACSALLGDHHGYLLLTNISLLLVKRAGLHVDTKCDLTSLESVKRDPNVDGGIVFTMRMRQTSVIFGVSYVSVEKKFVCCNRDDLPSSATAGVVEKLLQKFLQKK